MQWIQLYEFNDQLAASILKALSENFADYVIYTTDGSNILLIAKNNGELPDPDWSAVFDSGMEPHLVRLNVRSETDMSIRKIIDRDTLVPYLKRSLAPVNSDYYPYVDLNAGQARFKKTQATLFGAWMMPPLPVFEMLSDEPYDYEQLTSVPYLPRVAQADRAKYMSRRLFDESYSAGEDGAENDLAPTMHYLVELMRNEMNSCVPEKSWPDMVYVMHDIMINTLPFLNVEKANSLIDSIAETSCAIHDKGQVGEWIELYRAVAQRDARDMTTAASVLLADEANTPEVFYEFLVDAAMLGNIALGDGEVALNIWNRTGKELLAGRPLAAHTEVILSIALDSQAPTEPETRTASR